MVDTAIRRTVGLPAAAWLEVVPSATRFILRGAAGARAAAGEGFGISFPETACRAATDGDRSALWLGPDEQLLLAPDGQVERIEASLAHALQGHAYSLVDVSHRQVGLSVHGPHAEPLLESQCPLPLNLRDFPVGMCTRTVFGKAEIVLWRPAEQLFRLEVWRSFSLYVVQLLHEVAREL
ncbi:MAG: sarcosine oxidase, gamma subunit [Proteobacteria bacterium]|nr:sarcosine oxidase, gamma subunit [Pseudomonadota bacterium]